MNTVMFQEPSLLRALRSFRHVPWMDSWSRGPTNLVELVDRCGLDELFPKLSGKCSHK